MQCGGLNCFSTCIICSHGVSRFVVRNERFAEVLECPAFDLHAGSVHEVQIEMQIVQGDKAKAQNFLRLDQMPNVAARKSAACLAGAILFYWSFVPCELRIL